MQVDPDPLEPRNTDSTTTPAVTHEAPTRNRAPRTTKKSATRFPKPPAVPIFIVIVLASTFFFGFIIQLIVAGVACSIMGAVAIDNAKTREEEKGVVMPFVRLFLVWLTIRAILAAATALLHFMFVVRALTGGRTWPGRFAATPIIA